MFKGQNGKKKEPSKAELALMGMLGGVGKTIGTLPEPPQLQQEQQTNNENNDENEIPTPGTLLDIVVAELMHALDDISEQLSFVLYCGEKQGWISEDTKAEYAAWRQAQKEETQDESADRSRNRNIVPRKRDRNTRSIVVSQDGTVKYSHPEKPDGSRD